MVLTLRIWRKNARHPDGTFVDYKVHNAQREETLLDVIERLNEELESKREDPITFDRGCTDGKCGLCSLVIDGVPHGPGHQGTTCQLTLEAFEDGATVTLEPFRARAFKLEEDLMANREMLDGIAAAGGLVKPFLKGAAPPEAPKVLPKSTKSYVVEGAQCIDCGACVAICPNGSPMLYLAAKSAYLDAAFEPGSPEKNSRLLAMVDKMDEGPFGHCTNYGLCQDVCPRGISLDLIARLNRDYGRALFGPKAPAPSSNGAPKAKARQKPASRA